MLEQNSVNTKRINDESTEPMKNKKSESFLKRNLLLITTLAGVAVGTFTGFFLRPYHLSTDTIMLISYPGELFVRLLKLVTLPMLASSLVTVSANLNARMNGKIVLRTITYFATTSMISAFCGILIATFLQPGNVSRSGGLDEGIPTGQQTKFLDTILDLGRNLFPDNLFEATFQQTFTTYVPTNNADANSTLARVLTHRSGTNTMGIVLFCLVFGSLLSTMGERGRTVKDFFAATFEVTLKLITAIIWLTSVAVASIIAAKILSIDKMLEVFSQLASFIFCVLLGLSFHQLIMLPAIYFIFLREHPYTFLAKLIDPAVTLPTTLNCMNIKMGEDSRICNFVLTLGVSLNTNGAAMFMTISAVFIAQLEGVTLTYGSLFTILLMATIASMSIPSVPSSSMVMLLVILTTVNVDVQNISLLFAVDWMLDRCRTTSNVIGDCFAAAVLEKISKKDLEEMDKLSASQEEIAENESLIQRVV